MSYKQVYVNELMILSEYLSIWEIAHRWQVTDPNKSDPENLPLEIQDRLRYLCRLVLEGKLGLYNEIFISTDEDHGTICVIHGPVGIFKMEHHSWF